LGQVRNCGPVLPQWQFGKSTVVFISRDVAYNILEMKPCSFRGIFSPRVIHCISSGRCRSPYAFLLQYLPYTLSITMTSCVELEERYARQLHFVVQSLRRLDKRQMVSSCPQARVIVAKNNRCRLNLLFRVYARSSPSGTVLFYRRQILSERENLTERGVDGSVILADK